MVIIEIVRNLFEYETEIKLISVISLHPSYDVQRDPHLTDRGPSLRQ